MLPERLSWVIEGFEPEGDPWLMLQIARDLEASGNLAGAATVYDRAFGVAPDLIQIVEGRKGVLDRLQIREHGLVFRYVPGGPFLMGCRDGDPDEQPLHPVWLSPFWLSDTPISWTDYCRLLDWHLPPRGEPRDQGGEDDSSINIARGDLYGVNQIRLQYCETHTTRACDWHAHIPPDAVAQNYPFGPPPRTPADAPWEYASKPMVVVGWKEAEELAQHLSTSKVRYRLPTEAQWEKGARGGLIGARFPWGDEPPLLERCDCNQFSACRILPSRSLPANDYGLYAMAGCVWEWTNDWYDSGYYRDSPSHDPMGPATGQEKVLRGGSWADCADVVTNTYRWSRASGYWRDEDRVWGHYSPTIGFRLCRMAVSEG